MALLDSVLPLVGGIAGATVLYFIVMSFFAYYRHKREEKVARSVVRIERMTRDLWFDWVRNGGRR